MAEDRACSGYGLDEILRAGEGHPDTEGPVSLTQCHDCVPQSSHAGDNGDGPVPHADHLVQSAGLKTGRHEEEVRACFNGMGPCLIEPDMDAHVGRECLPEIPESLLECRVPIAEDHQLCIRLDQGRDGIQYAVDALLFHQAADDAEYRGVVCREREHVEQGAFAFTLALEVPGPVAPCGQGVGGGIPDLGIDAVRDACEFVRDSLEEALEAAPELGGLYLTGVGGTHGIDGIREHDACLHHVDPAEEFHAFRVEVFVGQKEHGPQDRIKEALVGEIVDGEKAAHVLDPCVLEVCEDQGCLPVVAVDDVDIADEADELDAGPREEGEPFEVVGIIVACIGVQARPVRKERVGDEEGRIVGKHPGFGYPGACEDGEISPGFQGKVEIPDLPVQGHDHGAAYALAVELGGQRGADISQPACLGVRRHLRGAQQDLHCIHARIIHDPGTTRKDGASRRMMHLLLRRILGILGSMDREEFEHSLREFESQVKKKLPSMINSYLANRGNREFEGAFTHLVEMLHKHRKMLLKDLSKVAKLEQKTRYFNAAYNMDSQLRSMDNRDAFKAQMNLRRRRVHAPVVYDLGAGPEEGELLNADDAGVLLETTEKVSVDQEVRISLDGKKARGKAMWSIPDETGRVETGVKLLDPSEDFLDEVRKAIKGSAKKSGNPRD